MLRFIKTCAMVACACARFFCARVDGEIAAMCELYVRARVQTFVSQAQTGGFNGGVRGSHAGLVFLLLLGELDDQHRVFHAHSRQHDKADLGEDVVLHRAQPDAGD